MKKLIFLLALPLSAQFNDFASGLDIGGPNIDSPTFASTYNQLWGYETKFNQTTQAAWDGVTKPTVLIGGEPLPLDAVNALGSPSVNYYTNTVLPYIQALESMGMTASKHQEHFPMLYLPFWKWESTNNCVGISHNIFLPAVNNPTQTQCDQAIWKDSSTGLSCLDHTGTAYSATNTWCGRVIAAYMASIQEMKSHGVAVISQTQVQPAGGDPFSLTNYYNSIFNSTNRCGGTDCWNSSSADSYGNKGYIQARAQQVVDMANFTCSPSCAPDYINFHPEPDTEYGKSFIPELNPNGANFTANVITIQQKIMDCMGGLTTDCNNNGTPIPSSVKRVVGMQNGEKSLTTVLTNELNLSPHPDVVDLHIHAINTTQGGTGVQLLNTMVPLFANTVVTYNSGHGTSIKMAFGDETQQYNQADSELGTAVLTQERSFPIFWQALDELFFQEVLTFSYLYSGVYISFSSPNYWFGELDYDAVGNSNGCIPFNNCSQSTWDSLENTQVNNAFNTPNSPTNPHLTHRGQFVKTMIASGVTKDVTAPTSPTNIAAVNNGVVNGYTKYTITWTASTDNVAVSHYRILRNGNIAGISLSTTYVDGYGGAGSLFSVQACDAAGNCSSPGQSQLNATGRLKFQGHLVLQ